MDNRSNARQPISADVELHFPGHDCVYAKARDISGKGMFVETKGVRLPPHAMVKIRVWTKARRSSFHILGIIVRRTGFGVGVMCLHGAESAEQQLQA
jgi:hypothetical protein